jgi:hypothetical protein
MNEPSEPVRPAAGEPTAPKQAMEAKTCPSCKRKLLTHASILCNWCGAKIDDPEYLEQAARQRQAMDEQERGQVEAVAEQEARYGVFGRLKRLGKNKAGPNKPLM